MMTDDPQQLLARPMPVFAKIEPNVAVSGVRWTEEQLQELHYIYTNIAQTLLQEFEREVVRPEWAFYSEKKDISMSVRPPSTPCAHNSLVTTTIACPPTLGNQYVADWDCRFQWDKFLGEINILHHYLTNDKSKSMRFSIPFSPDYDCVLFRMTTNKRIWLKPRDSILLQLSGPHPTRPKSMITVCATVTFGGCPPINDFIRSSCSMLAWLFEPINDGQHSKFTHICNFEFGRDTSSITEMLIVPFFPKMPVVNCFNKIIFIRSKLKELSKQHQQQQFNNENDKRYIFPSSSSSSSISSIHSSSSSTSTTSTSSTTPLFGGYNNSNNNNNNNNSNSQLISKNTTTHKKRYILTTNFSMHPNDWAQFILNHNRASKWKTVHHNSLPSGVFLLYDQMKATNKTRGKGSSKKLVIKSIFEIPHPPEHVNLLLMDKDLRWDPFIHTIKYADKGIIATGGGSSLSKKLKLSIPSFKIQCLQYHGFVDNKTYFLEERDNGDVILFTMSKPGHIPNALTTSIEWYFFIFTENWIDKVEPPTDYYLTQMQKSISSFYGSSMKPSTSSSSKPEKSDITKIVDIFVKILAEIYPTFTTDLSFPESVKISDIDPQRGNKRELQLIEDSEDTYSTGSDDMSSLETSLSLSKKSKRSKEFHLNVPTDKFFDMPTTAMENNNNNLNNSSSSFLLPPFVPSKVFTPFSKGITDIGSSNSNNNNNININNINSTLLKPPSPRKDILCMPSEILNHIFSFLCDVDLCRCARTCRAFKRLSERDCLWYCLYVRWFGKCCFKQSNLDTMLPPNITVWDNYRKTTFPQSALDPPFKDPAKTYFLSKETMYESINGNWKKKFFLKIRMEALWALCRGEQPLNTGGDFGSENDEGFTMMSICSYKISPSLFALIPNCKDEYISAILLHHSYAFFSTNTGDFYKVNLWSSMESYDQIFTKLNTGQFNNNHKNINQIENNNHNNNNNNNSNNNQNDQIMNQDDNIEQTDTRQNNNNNNNNVNTISLWLNQQNVLHSVQSNKVLLKYNLETKQAKNTIFLENKKIPSSWDIVGASQSYFGDHVAVHYNNNYEDSINDDYDTLLDLFDADSGRLMTTLDKREQITCSSFNKTRVAIGGQRGPIDLFDCNTGRSVISFLGHTKQVLTCRLLDDEDCVISSSDDNTVKFYDERTGPYYLKRLQSQWPVKTFDLTPNRLICATSTKISYWDPRNLQSPIGELWSPLTTDVMNIQLSQFNVMVLYSNGICHAWDFR